MNVGVMGAGTISPIYLSNLTRDPAVRVVAIADLRADRARERADAFGVPHAVSPQQLLARPDIELVVNLTVPASHAAVSLAALEANKHVYSEKPLAVEPAQAARLMATAARVHRYLTSAPDTVLGAGIQTARQLLDQGAVGRPVGAALAFMNHGHEHWHPDPAFYYQVGGGPVMDMGPYYLTALVMLLGPVRRVFSGTTAAFAERIVGSGPKRDERVRVDVPTHVAAVLETAQGSWVQAAMSFDVWHHRLPCFEIYGTEGTLAVPDPNTFDGPVLIRRAGDEEWRAAPLRPDLPVDNARGLGVTDTVRAICEGRPARLDARVGSHVLDILDAMQRGGATSIASTVARPEPMPVRPSATGD